MGNQTAREGHSVFYTRLSRLPNDIATTPMESRVGAPMGRIAKIDLLIVDNWAKSELTAAQRWDRMEIFDDRHGCRSIIPAS